MLLIYGMFTYKEWKGQGTQTQRQSSVRE